MTKIEQSSSGKNSPIICGDGNVVSYAEYSGVTREVKSIMRLISLLSQKATKELKNIKIEPEMEKNISLKIDVRFANFNKQLKKDFEGLHVHYAEKYNEAWKESELTESSADEIAQYLIFLSREELSRCNDNPVQALYQLTKSLEDELKKVSGESDFSQGAIRYYLFIELIKCNVFPNPLE